jgi:lysine 2,3-aminomutase
MLEKKSKYIEELGKTNAAIARQFVASEEERLTEGCEYADPLNEDQHQVVKGLVHKYPNRVLCVLTAECAAYCRFCTRRRLVSDVERGRVYPQDIDVWAEYIEEHPYIKEVILSGGDPLVVSVELLSYAFNRLGSIPSIKVMRMGTRVPVSSPDLLTEERLEIIRSVKQPVYVGIHFEHPNELTDETLAAVTRLRKAGAILYSQTVFLAGVNDDYQTLYDLFSGLVEVGVRPYYIYRCDPVSGINHFRVDFEKERSIMTRLRKSLSGMACPMYVIDTPNGNGKVPVPLDFWDFDAARYKDFTNEEHEVI